MYYSLSLPITAVVIGMPKFDHIEENRRLAKAFKPMPASEKKKMADELSAKYKALLYLFFRATISTVISSFVISMRVPWPGCAKLCEYDSRSKGPADESAICRERLTDILRSVKFCW